MDMKTLKVLELALIVGAVFWFYRSQTRSLKRRDPGPDAGETPQPPSGGGDSPGP